MENLWYGKEGTFTKSLAKSIYLINPEKFLSFWCFWFWRFDDIYFFYEWNQELLERPYMYKRCSLWQKRNCLVSNKEIPRVHHLGLRPVGICQLKVNNRNSRTRGEMDVVYFDAIFLLLNRTPLINVYAVDINRIQWNAIQCKT